MQDFGLVSVIMPTYNCASYIEAAIRCVQAQTYTNWEIIIVDDCSADNTQEVIANLAESRVRYIKNDTNQGAAISRNLALQKAKGHWIAFLDSDDLWMPQKLETQLRFMVEHHCHFSYTEYILIDEQSNQCGIRISGPRKINRCGMLNYCWMGCLTVMYDVSQVGVIQIEDIKKNNDYAIWLEVSKHVSCYLLPEVLAQYRIRANSISRQSKFSLIKWHYRLFRIVEHQNKFCAILNTCRNLIFGVYKKLRYHQTYKVSKI